MAEKLSENFTLEELIYSDTAKARGIDNSPTALHKKILKHTAQYLLEKIRALLNEKYKTYNKKEVKYVALKVTSGYRSEKLNLAVKGSNTSQHLNGSACDIEARIVFKDGTKKVLPYTELYANIKQWVKEKKMSVDQCIQEKSGNAVWIHASHHPSGRTKDRRQFLIYLNGMYRLDCDLD
jgi:hypothetical protein